MELRLEKNGLPYRYSSHERKIQPPTNQRRTHIKAALKK